MPPSRILQTRIIIIICVHLVFNSNDERLNKTTIFHNGLSYNRDSKGVLIVKFIIKNYPTPIDAILIIKCIAMLPLLIFAKIVRVSKMHLTWPPGKPVTPALKQKEGPDKRHVLT